MLLVDGVAVGVDVVDSIEVVAVEVVVVMVDAMDVMVAAAYHNVTAIGIVRNVRI